MSKRPPSPIRVTSPVSSNHIVSIHPEQDLVVTFDPQKEAISMKSDSDFIEVIQDSMTYFKFGQVFNFSDWAKDSKLYLGNIAFDKGDNTPIVNLSVVLESLKKNNIKVINPRDCQLKIDAEDIIEVIICEPTVNNLLCDIIGGEKNLTYVRDFQLSVNGDSTAFYSGNRIKQLCVDTKESPSLIGTLPNYRGVTKEHHFWFKLTKESIKKSKELTSGSYNAGKIVFIIPKVGTVYQIDFLLDVREKKRKKERKAAKRLLLPVTSNTKNRVKNKVKNKVKVVYKSEPYRPQKVLLTQKLQPALDDNCHWEWHHEFNPNSSFRAYKKLPPETWEDSEGFVRTKRGDIIGYAESYGFDNRRDDDFIGIYK